MNLRLDLLFLMRVMNLMGGGQKKKGVLCLILLKLLLRKALFFMPIGKRLNMKLHV